MNNSNPRTKILAGCGLILIVLLLATPVAAKTFPTSVFTRDMNIGIHEYMEDYGYRASSVEEMGSYFHNVMNLDLPDPPTPADHPIPIPTALMYQTNRWSIEDFITIK